MSVGMWVKMFTYCPSIRWSIRPSVRMQLYSFVYVSVRLSVYQFEYYLYMCPCVRPSACMHILYDIVCDSISLNVFFPFVRPSERPSVLSSSVRMIMHACKSVVYKHIRDIPYFYLLTSNFLFLTSNF